MQDLIEVMEGYKMVNEDMTCRGVTFEVGVKKTLGNSEPLELCKNGFHFCKHPSGVWSYYDEGRMFKVKAYSVLKQEEEPGADYKLVCREIELVEEIKITGDQNTGDCNTGERNTGSGNTGDRNTGYGNTGGQNTGDGNTGDQNTGSGNTGGQNTGDGNTGDQNTGSGNCGSYHSGFFNVAPEAPLYIFDKIVYIKRAELDYILIAELNNKILKDDDFDITPFLSIPNATPEAIKSLHEKHKAIRKERL